jgi:flagellar hook-length control protein FliK
VPKATATKTSAATQSQTATAATDGSADAPAAGPTATAAQQAAVANKQNAADSTADGAQASDGSATSSSITTAATPAHDHSAAATTDHAPAAPDTNVQAAGNIQPPLPAAAANSIAAGSVSVTAATHAVPLSGLALEIAASAKNGKSSFEIRLDPADLGRIDVRIDVDRNGQMTSHLTVEKPETLSMLQQDAPQLQRALDNAGFKTGDGGLQFSLRDQSSSGQNSGGDTNRNAQRLVISSNDDTAPTTTAGRTYGRMLGSSSGVDIRV